MSKTSMVISKVTRDKLAALGGKDDSFEEIIKRLLDEHERFKTLRPLENEGFEAFVDRLAKQYEEGHKNV